MATLRIRDLDGDLWARLEAAAAAHGCSVEAEARSIIEERFAPGDGTGLGSRIHARFAELGGVELALDARGEADASGVP